MGRKSKSDRKLTPRLKEKEVQWVVNDLAELGVCIKGVCYFLYKGESLVYNDTPMMVRPVGKREFGEVCQPPHMMEAEFEAPYTEGEGWTPLT